MRKLDRHSNITFLVIQWWVCLYLDAPADRHLTGSSGFRFMYYLYLYIVAVNLMLDETNKTQKTNRENRGMDTLGVLNGAPAPVKPPPAGAQVVDN